MSVETTHAQLPTNVVLLMFRAGMQPEQIVRSLTGRGPESPQYAADLAWVQRLLRTAYPQAFPTQPAEAPLNAE